MIQKSIWYEENEELLSFPSISKDLSCDICIIGSGLCGLYSAYLISKEGSMSFL